MATSVGSGIGSSVGLASETTWGTPATPVKWPEFESESLEWQPKRMVGKGLANGLLVQRSSQEVTPTSTVVGDIKCPVYYKNMGLLLGGAFGSLTTTPTQQGATTAYLQTHALGNPYGQSLTVQKGVPQLGGTIQQYTYNGLKVEQAVWECGVDEYLNATYTFDGRGYDTTTAYTSPSYVSNNPIFAFNQSFFRIGAYGSEVNLEAVRKVTVTLKRPLRKDMFYADGTGLKQQQVQNGFVEILVDIETDYLSDAAFVQLFEADTAQSIIWDFIGPQIAAGAGGAKTITAVSTSSTGAQITATSHGFTNGQVVSIAGVTGTGSPSPNGIWVVGNVTTNTFTIGQNNTGFTYTSGGTATLNYYNQFSLAIPALRWRSEQPKITGPDIVQPKMTLQGFYDDSHAAIQATYMSTDTTL